MQKWQKDQILTLLAQLILYHDILRTLHEPTKLYIPYLNHTLFIKIDQPPALTYCYC
jgi:hypothetical protein